MKNRRISFVCILLSLILLLSMMIISAEAGALLFQPGDSGAAVDQVINRLIELYYVPKVLDGSCNQSVSVMIARFQSRNALPVTGEVDQTTWEALFSPDAVTYTGGTLPPAFDDPTPSPISAAPTPLPTAIPTASPTPMPTATPRPTPSPTPTPTAAPTALPTSTPTAAPTPLPTAIPTATPVPAPTETPAPVINIITVPDDRFETRTDFSCKESLGTTGVIITRYTGTDPDIRIPDYIGGHPVTVIGLAVFSGRNLRSVILPQTLVMLEDHAFNSCKSLISVTISSDRLETIGLNPFEGCTDLLSEGIHSCSSRFIIRDGLLYDNDQKRLIWVPTAARECTIAEDTVEIGDKAMKNCPYLLEVSIPESVTKLWSNSISHKITLIVAPGSYIEKFAEANGYPYRVR